jgi:hypothetical protein
LRGEFQVLLRLLKIVGGAGNEWAQVLKYQ